MCLSDRFMGPQIVGFVTFMTLEIPWRDKGVASVWTLAELSRIDI
jgi:hypothetical protein